MPTPTIRFDEQQLLELASKARIHSNKKGYLQKCDHKFKKLTSRWCCLYQNVMFYFESEGAAKPSGVVFLEGTSCTPVDQIGIPTQLDLSQVSYKTGWNVAPVYIN